MLCARIPSAISKLDDYAAGMMCSAIAYGEKKKVLDNLKKLCERGALAHTLRIPPSATFNCSMSKAQLQSEEHGDRPIANLR